MFFAVLDVAGLGGSGYCRPQCRRSLSDAQGPCNVSFLPKERDSQKHTPPDALRGLRVDLMLVMNRRNGRIELIPPWKSS